MRKVRVFLVAFLFLVSSGANASFSSPAPKAGAKCLKAGATQVSAGKKFTCLSSGKKLIWSVGIKVAQKPKPLPVVTNQPVSTPSPTPTPTKNNILPARWALNEPVTSVESLLLIADAVERKRISQISLSEVPIDLRLGPTTNKVNADLYLAGLRSAAKYWSLDFNPKEPVVVALAEVQDYEFMKALWPQFGLNGGGFDDSKEHWSQQGAQCNAGSAIYANAPFFWGCLSSTLNLSEIGLRKFSAHEYTHIVQYHLANEGSNFRSYNLPNLFAEGSADFFGVTYSSSPSQIEADWERYRSIGYISSEAKSALRSGNSETMFELITDSMNKGTKVSSHWYFTGAYATARLVAAEGHETFVRYIKESGKTKDAIAAFKTVYGMSFEDFAKIISPELVEFAKKLR